MALKTAATSLTKINVLVAPKRQQHKELAAAVVIAVPLLAPNGSFQGGPCVHYTQLRHWSFDKMKRPLQIIRNYPHCVEV